MIKKEEMDLEKIGYLVVPFSKWKFRQMISWMRDGSYEDTHPPVDLSILPKTPSFGALKETPTFYLLRDVEVSEDNPDEILFVYDRVRIKRQPGLQEEPVDLSEDLSPLIEEAKRILLAEHGIGISSQVLETLLKSNPELSSLSEASEIVAMITDDFQYLSSEGSFVHDFTTVKSEPE